MQILNVLSALVLTLVLAGCTSSTANYGKVKDPKVTKGSRVEAFSYVDSTGKSRRLDLGRSSGIIAFVDVDNAQELKKLVEISGKFQQTKGFPNVVLIARKKICDKIPALYSGDKPPKRLYSLCDGNGYLHTIYGVSSGRSLFLLDTDGNVVEVGGLSNLDAFAKKAMTWSNEKALKKEREQQQEG